MPAAAGRWGHDPAFVFDLALRAVPGGIIGGRLYQFTTDFNRLYVHNLSGIPKIWDGGLGIPGGVGVGWWYARNGHQPVPDLLDMVALRCRWPRPSDGSATTSTRNSSGVPAPCR